MFIFLACSVLLGLLVSQSVMVCLSLAGVSKAVENINKIIAPALVRNQVGPFTLSSDHCCLLVSGKKEMKIVDTNFNGNYQNDTNLNLTVLKSYVKTKCQNQKVVQLFVGLSLTI